MQLLLAAVQRHPGLIIAVTIVVAFLLIAFAADWFIGVAEGGEPEVARR